MTAHLLQPTTPDSSPGGEAPASGGGGGGFGGMSGMLIMLLPVLLIVFMMRSQNKKQKDIEASLKVGDRVGTRGGAIGKIVRLGERTVDLELAPGVTVSFRKEAIDGPDVDPKTAAADKKDDKKDAKDGANNPSSTKKDDKKSVEKEPVVAAAKVKDKG